jgi:hypothetical protein
MLMVVSTPEPLVANAPIAARPEGPIALIERRTTNG